MNGAPPAVTTNGERTTFALTSCNFLYLASFFSASRSAFSILFSSSESSARSSSSYSSTTAHPDSERSVNLIIFCLRVMSSMPCVISQATRCSNSSERGAATSIFTTCSLNRNWSSFGRLLLASARFLLALGTLFEAPLAFSSCHRGVGQLLRLTC